MRILFCLCLMLCFAACGSQGKAGFNYDDEDHVPTVFATTETIPVDSIDDAADDPAIWYNTKDPSQSLILGTDKQAGLGIYTLEGKLKQFIPAGLPNNVDLRQNVTVGTWQGDLAAASNRDGDVITLFDINADGGKIIGEFPAGLTEPYGTCMGIINDHVVVFVTYKTGEVQMHLLSNISAAHIAQEMKSTITLQTQLEGCAYDESTNVLYIGEEGRGLWQSTISLNKEQLNYSSPLLVDEVEGISGLKADVEGVTLYRNGDKNYIVISSQGNDSYAIYQQSKIPQFVKRFRIGDNHITGIDGSQETDGIAADGRSFGAKFPKGILVVQDGFNMPAGEAQNFKIVDWRDIAKVLEQE